jgi:hypothetical protein
MSVAAGRTLTSGRGWETQVRTGPTSTSRERTHDLLLDICFIIILHTAESQRLPGGDIRVNYKTDVSPKYYFRIPDFKKIFLKFCVCLLLQLIWFWKIWLKIKQLPITLVLK